MLIFNYLTRRQADRLVERYFEAETTEREERRLRRFLASRWGRAGRYDEVRAVMGFIAAGNVYNKGVRLLPRRRAVSLYRTVGIAASFLIVAGAAIGFMHHRAEQNLCIAYVGGTRVTDTDRVLSEMKRSISSVARPDDAPTIEAQLSDMFNTIEGEGLPTND